MSLLSIPATIELPAEGWLRGEALEASRNGSRRVWRDAALAAGVAREAGLTEAFARCKAITRLHARNFYLGLSLAPEPRRSALLAIYTWMRHADDLADDPGRDVGERLEGLRSLRALTAAALAPQGGAAAPLHDADFRAQEPGWWAAFVASARAYQIPPTVFMDTLDALEADARGVAVRDEGELARYCDRVAGTVAVACVCIWGLRERADERAAWRRAILRGRAVQLTNILRDVREDLGCEPRRVYVPAASLARHGVEAEGLMAWTPANGCEAVFAEWTAEARRLYEASVGLEDLVDPACARVCWALAAVYRALLERIASEPDRAVRERLRVARGRKLRIALAGWLGVGLPG
ncbi:MAG: squalene/phytoene synthase family protein [Phycisphaeraceae bacterium]|nr:squalene/phytoene synthase family protein [Phycisphaeraceae bacterium]